MSASFMECPRCKSLKKSLNYRLIRLWLHGFSSIHSSTRESRLANMTEPSGQIDHVLTENRSFPPPAEFTEKAVFSSMEQYEEVYRQAAEDRDGFWRNEANEHLHWFEPFDEVCQWEAPHAKWFVGGKTNAADFINELTKKLEKNRENYFVF